ncbi:hypothetical protein ACFVH6_19225 [Spirillospora sp. NPDC127200]
MNEDLLRRLAPQVLAALVRRYGEFEAAEDAVQEALLEPLAVDARLAAHHRLHAVRAHLLELAGDHQAAGDGYRTAARLTTGIPEQRYLAARARALDKPKPAPAERPGRAGGDGLSGPR